MNKFSFSGHESFNCRYFWLKKGFDFIKQGNKFTDDDAVVKLGVGKNMVSAIKFWLESFGLVTIDGETTEFADLILSDNGYDPFLEHESTLWLLHYKIVTTKRASIYSLIFNEYRKTRFDFTKSHLENFIKQKSKELNFSFNERVIKTDVSVFIRNYLSSNRKSNNIEDDYMTIFHDLGLIRPLASHKQGEQLYSLEGLERDQIHSKVILATICDNGKYSNTITFNELLNAFDSVGQIFCLNSNGLMTHIQNIVNTNSNIVFTEDAGIRVLQFKKKPSFHDALRGCYE